MKPHRTLSCKPEIYKQIYNCRMDEQEYTNQSGDLWHIFVKQCNISPHLKVLRNKIQET